MSSRRLKINGIQKYILYIYIQKYKGIEREPNDGKRGTVAARGRVEAEYSPYRMVHR